jgi:hypothetical protein
MCDVEGSGRNGDGVARPEGLTAGDSKRKNLLNKYRGGEEFLNLYCYVAFMPAPSCLRIASSYFAVGE